MNSGEYVFLSLDIGLSGVIHLPNGPSVAGKVESARAEERMTRVMELLSHVSLVGTVDAFAQGTDAWLHPPSWTQFALSCSTVIGMLVVRYRFRASSR